MTVSAATDPTFLRGVQRQGGAVAGVQWEYARSEQVRAHVTLGVQHERFDLADGPRDRRYAVQLDPSLGLRGHALGDHEAKIGLQTRFVAHDYDSPALANQQWGLGGGLYVQDRWQPWRRLTLLPGLRVDWGMTRNSAGRTVSSLFGLGPRLGAIWDLAGDAKTFFRFFYGRSNETLSLLAAASAESSYQLDRRAATPHADEIVLGLRRLLPRSSVASVDYTYKKLANIWDGIEINQIWNAAGTHVVGYVDGSPHQLFRYTTPDGNWRIYHGLDFVFSSRPSPLLDLYAAYTLSWLYGPGAEELGQVGGGEAGNSQYYNPRQAVFFDGFLPEDVRHTLKLRASYTWRGLVAGGFFRYQTGAPFTRRYFNPADDDYTLRRAPQDSERTAATVELDARVAYDFHELLSGDGRHHLVVLADLFNLFDQSDGQQPFRFQIGLRYTY